MNRQRSFPPGIGWIPFSVAILLALIVATVAIVPQYGTRPIGSQGGDNGGVANAQPSDNQAGTDDKTLQRGGTPGGPRTKSNQPGSVSCEPGKNGGATDKGHRLQRSTSPAP